MAEKLDANKEIIKNHNEHGSKVAHEVFDGKYQAPKSEIESWKHEHAKNPKENEVQYEQRAQHEVKMQKLAKELGLPEGCVPAGIAKSQGREYLMVKQNENGRDALYSVDMKTGKVYQRFEKTEKGYLPTETHSEDVRKDNQGRVQMMKDAQGRKIEFGYSDDKSDKPTTVTWHEGGKVYHYSMVNGQMQRSTMSETEYIAAFKKHQADPKQDIWANANKEDNDIKSFQTKFVDGKPQLTYEMTDGVQKTRSQLGIVELDSPPPNPMKYQFELNAKGEPIKAAINGQPVLHMENGVWKDQNGKTVEANVTTSGQFPITYSELDPEDKNRKVATYQWSIDGSVTSRDVDGRISYMNDAYQHRREISYNTNGTVKDVHINGKLYYPGADVETNPGANGQRDHVQLRAANDGTILIDCPDPNDPSKIRHMEIAQNGTIKQTLDGKTVNLTPEQVQAFYEYLNKTLKEQQGPTISAR